jgi:hypothetical protein
MNQVSRPVSGSGNRTQIVSPVATRITAKTYSTQENRATLVAPSPIMTARSTIAPRIPQKRPRRCTTARGGMRFPGTAQPR